MLQQRCESMPEGFNNREPASRQIRHSQLISLRSHHEWSGDGHDKLVSIGFPIWGIQDKFSGKWLGLWVVPCNQLRRLSHFSIFI